MEATWSYHGCMHICLTEFQLNYLAHKETLKELGSLREQEKAMDGPDDNLNSMFEAAK